MRWWYSWKKILLEERVYGILSLKFDKIYSFSTSYMAHEWQKMLDILMKNLMLCTIFTLEFLCYKYTGFMVCYSAP